MISLTIDGQKVEVEEGKTVLDAARQAGIKIPALCYHEALRPYGSCRVCLVEISQGNGSVIRTSCLYPALEGMEVKTDTDRVIRARKLMVELLLARCPDSEEIQKLAE